MRDRGEGRRASQYERQRRARRAAGRRRRQAPVATGVALHRRCGRAGAVCKAHVAGCRCKAHGWRCRWRPAAWVGTQACAPWWHLIVSRCEAGTAGGGLSLWVDTQAFAPWRQLVVTACETGSRGQREDLGNRRRLQFCTMQFWTMAEAAQQRRIIGRGTQCASADQVRSFD
eukprot:365198-Chlamydomonas_euryale.AAC.8